MDVLGKVQHALGRWQRRRRRFRSRGVRVWYHPDYRVPIEGLGLETKRPDLCLWALLDHGAIVPADVSQPARVGYRALAVIHDEHVLSGLSDPNVLAPVFGAHPSELPMETIARTIRLACGGTLGAARRAIGGGGPQVNLLGGFHHASPRRAGGFSVVNDIAVSIAALRAQGFTGSVGVLDVDAHPPDGTADCVNTHRELLGDVWIGSISAADWGPLPGVDETFLPGADDKEYAEALEALLSRMPPAELTYVVAGGDVIAGDRFGGFELTLDGARHRDERIARALGLTPSVWLSAGGYSSDAWKVLFNTVVAASGSPAIPLRPDYDPVRVRFSRVMSELASPTPPDDVFSEIDLADALGMRAPGGPRLLSTYTAEWLEHALQRYGILEHIARLGYSAFRVDVDRNVDGDRMRVYGTAQGTEHLLIEAVVDRVTENGERYLFVNWLTLRHPIARFTVARPQLPNQDVPGLGLAKEAGELLGIMAGRLGLDGVAIRPAAFHVAYTARYDFAFADPERQARFEALVRDLGERPLAEVTVAIDEGRVLHNGVPYKWEPDLMVSRLDGERQAASGDGGTFTLVDASGR